MFLLIFSDNPPTPPPTATLAINVNIAQGGADDKQQPKRKTFNLGEGNNIYLVSLGKSNNIYLVLRYDCEEVGRRGYGGNTGNPDSVVNHFRNIILKGFATWGGLACDEKICQIHRFRFVEEQEGKKGAERLDSIYSPSLHFLFLIFLNPIKRKTKAYFCYKKKKTPITLTLPTTGSLNQLKGPQR